MKKKSGNTGSREFGLHTKKVLLGLKVAGFNPAFTGFGAVAVN